MRSTSNSARVYSRKRGGVLPVLDHGLHISNRANIHACNALSGVRTSEVYPRNIAECDRRSERKGATRIVAAHDARRIVARGAESLDRLIPFVQHMNLAEAPKKVVNDQIEQRSASAPAP